MDGFKKYILEAEPVTFVDKQMNRTCWVTESKTKNKASVLVLDKWYHLRGWGSMRWAGNNFMVGVRGAWIKRVKGP